MSIAPTLQRYLDQNVTYEMVPHARTLSAARTAQVCHISGDRLAKGVILRCSDRYVLAVVPATHVVRLADLRNQLGDDVALADECEFARLFPDCERGAVPALGECYSLDMVVDDAIDGLPEVYMEAGDHATLVRLDCAQFDMLVRDAWHGRFSERTRH